MGRETGWQGRQGGRGGRVLCWAGASGHPSTYPVTPGLEGVGSEPHLRVQLLIPSPGEKAKEPLWETGPETYGQPAHLARPDPSLGGSVSSTAGRITDAPSTTSSPGAQGSGTHARSPYRRGNKRTHLSGVFLGVGWGGRGSGTVFHLLLHQLCHQSRVTPGAVSAAVCHHHLLCYPLAVFSGHLLGAGTSL